MTLLILIQLLLLIFQVGSRNLLSRLGTQSSAFYRCFRQSGFNQLLTLIQGGQGGFSDDEIEGLNNAKNAGILVDVTISPCRGREPEEELKFLIGQVGQGVLHKIFAVPESEEDFCDWSSNTPASNCQYLQKFLQLGKKYNVTIGVGSSIDVWEQSFGSTSACPEVSNSPLYWFPNEDQFDLNPDFRSYHQFGGWKVPYMKMYNMTRVCNKGFQVNYFV